MSIGAAINDLVSSLQAMPVAMRDDAVPAAAPGSEEPITTSAETDSVEISTEASMVAAEDLAVGIEAERLIFPAPFPYPGSDIDALTNNLRQRENLERQMFRLQDEAIDDRKVGTLASDGTSPDSLREQANELREDGKFDQARKLDEQAWLMDGRGIPEDDPGTVRNELKDAGERLIQRADDKQTVASLIGEKLEDLEEDFVELVENVDFEDDKDFRGPIFIASAEVV